MVNVETLLASYGYHYDCTALEYVGAGKKWKRNQGS